MLKDLFNSFFQIYEKEADTYKDTDGRGIFERYIEIFQIELTSEIIPAGENFLDMKDAWNTPERFLTVISESFGNPPNLLANNAIGKDHFNRGLLQHYVPLRKLKGTYEGIRMIFAYLGYRVTINEKLETEFYYDSVDTGKLYHKYDDGHFYDSPIPDFGTYDVAIISHHPDALPLTDDLITKIYPIIHWMEPIDMRLKSISTASQIIMLESGLGILSTEQGAYFEVES